MSAPSNSGLSVELLLRVIDVKCGYFTFFFLFKASNGRPLKTNRKILVKINRCLFEIKTVTG